MSHIALLGVNIPSTSGGAELLSKVLASELTARGHEVTLTEFPLSFSPKENLLNHAAMWRALSINELYDKDVDLVIATKFPTYFARHTRKSIWLVHQHRQIYDLFGTTYSDFSDDPRDEAMRKMLNCGDTIVIQEADYISAISNTVANRLLHYNDVNAEVLYPPLPLRDRYHCKAPEDYILSVGRLCSIKRVDLMIRALSVAHSFLKLKVVGIAEEPGIMEHYHYEIDKLGLNERVEFLGRVSDEELLDLYAHSFAVYYAPYDEDYGFVTLEAFASSKPVITANDSGGTLEFVRHEHNGLILPPNPDSIGHSINSLLANKQSASNMGKRAYEFITKSGLMGSSWDNVINSLLSPLDINQNKVKACH